MSSSQSSYNWPMRVANKIMANYPDQFKDRLPIMIWAAKFTKCPRCGAEPGTPCWNLAQQKKQIEQSNIWPHTERVDWQKLVLTLKKRGYRIYV